MLDWPFVVVTVTVLAVALVSIGLVRRDRPWTVALDAVGFILFAAGIAWAQSTGSSQAVAAVFVASLGAILFTMSDARRRIVRAPEVADGS